MESLCGNDRNISYRVHSGGGFYIYLSLQPLVALISTFVEHIFVAELHTQAPNGATVHMVKESETHVPAESLRRRGVQYGIITQLSRVGCFYIHVMSKGCKKKNNNNVTDVFKF